MIRVPHRRALLCVAVRRQPPVPALPFSTLFEPVSLFVAHPCNVPRELVHQLWGILLSLPHVWLYEYKNYRHKHCPLWLTWVLGIWSQVLTLAQQTRYPLSPLSSALVISKGVQSEGGWGPEGPVHQTTHSLGLPAFLLVWGYCLLRGFYGSKWAFTHTFSRLAKPHLRNEAKILEQFT